MKTLTDMLHRVVFLLKMRYASTLLPDKGPPIQIPSGFFFQLLDTGVITRLRPEEDTPVSSEVDRLMDMATPADQRQANERFEKVIAYLQGEKNRYANVVNLSEGIAPSAGLQNEVGYRRGTTRVSHGPFSLPPSQTGLDPFSVIRLSSSCFRKDAVDVPA